MKDSKRSLVIGLVGYVVMVTSAVSYANCESTSCVNTTYFSEYGQVVGTHSTCPGMKGLRGKKTQWFEQEEDAVRWCNDRPLDIPCSFTDKGC